MRVLAECSFAALAIQGRQSRLSEVRFRVRHLRPVRARAELELSHLVLLSGKMIHAETQRRRETQKFSFVQIVVRRASRANLLMRRTACRGRRTLRLCVNFFLFCPPVFRGPKRRKTADFRGRLRSGRSSRIGRNVHHQRYGRQEIVSCLFLMRVLL